MNEALEAARGFIRKGWAPVPVLHKSKKAVLKGWQNLKIDEDSLERYFGSDRCNVGVLLGTPSNNLVDADLDSSEALSLSPSFLPETDCVFGHESKPRSHRLYIVDAATGTTKFKDTNDEMLVELRGTGGQTVFPPSVHESGEDIVFYQNGEPALVTTQELTECVCRLASASLLARHWPGEGSRQDAAMALAGGFLRVGWPEEQVYHLIEAVTLAAGDEEAGQRLTCVSHTYQKITEDIPTTGFPTLMDFFDPKVIALLRRWLGMSLGGYPAGKVDSKQSQAAALINIARSKGELFHSDRQLSYSVVDINGNQAIMPIKSRGYKTLLQYDYYSQTGKSPGQNAVTSAVATLEGIASFEGKEYQLQNRVALQDNQIFYDLSDPKGRAVSISAGSWCLIEKPGILFERFTHQKAQAMPVPGGDPFKLLRYTNLKSKDDEILFMVSTLCCFIPDIPHPILYPYGDKGGGKSTTLRVIRSIVDPSLVQTHALPTKPDELIQVFSHNYVAPFDNIDKVNGWQSDAICRAVTGEGSSKRRLFTDDDDFIYSFRRVVILNGINLSATRPDFLDRCISLELERISESARMSEKDFWRVFEEDKPLILGGIMDAISSALAILPGVKLDKLPRMADFATYGYAIAEAINIGGDRFLEAYYRNIGKQNELAIESHPVAQVVAVFMERRPEWTGTPAELLEALERVAKDQKVDTDSKLWPKAPNTLTKRLNEVKSNLLDTGVEYESTRQSSERRITLTAKHCPASIYDDEPDEETCRSLFPPLPIAFKLFSLPDFSPNRA